MSQQALPLGDDEPRSRRHGPARAAVERSLGAWRRAGHLEGPAYAAAARVLRDSADAVDAAHAAMHPVRCPQCRAPVPDAYAGSPGALAYANNIHAALIAAAQPAAGDASDPYGSTDPDADAALAAAVTAALAGDDSPPDPDAPEGH